jgi:16S rRNA (guanine1516-N2)-methyltransferase
VGSFGLDLNLISIWAEKEKSFARADELAERLSLQVGRSRPKTFLSLYVDKEKLGLGFSREIPFRPYYVDFCSREWRFRRRKGLSANRLFLTALGIKERTTILDLTAGFGQDSFMMAWAGANVVALERSPIVFEILEDGLRRAFADDSGWHHGDRLKIVRTEGADFLKTCDPFDVIYFDPMFDKPKKKAKSPKAMQLLQSLLTPDADQIEKLFALAKTKARSRIVIKLPLKGELPLPKPNVTFAGQSIRYDVYLLQ